MSKAAEVINKIHRVNRIREEKLEEGKPTTGMFYVFPEDIWPDRVYSILEPLETSVEQDGYLTTPASHTMMWSLLQNHIPQFKGLRYDHFPRGRLFYHDGKFEIRIDPCVAKDKKVINKIISDMNLKKGNYKVVSDNSYTCKDCSK